MGELHMPDFGAGVEGELRQASQQREPEVHVLVLVCELDACAANGRDGRTAFACRRDEQDGRLVCDVTKKPTKEAQEYVHRD